MKNLAKTTLGIVAVLMLSLAFIQCKDAKDAVITKFLEVQVEQQNKLCPQAMGNGLTLTKCSIEENKTLKFHISLTEEAASQLGNMEDMKLAFVQALKAQPEFEKIKEYEISYAYAFVDQNDKSVAEVKITPEDYK